MGIRFRKTIKIGDLIKLNISKSGVSATLGKKGASINIGGKGTYFNVSPTIAGIKGTGVSYRQKITGGYGDAIKKLIGLKDSKNKDVENEVSSKELEELDTSEIDKYYKDLEAIVNIYKYADNVLDEEGLKEQLKNFDNESSKELYELALNGDEEVIESLIEAFLNKLELAYEVKANFELKNHVLYVDLDLPEIEELPKEYPTIVKNKIVYKKKATAALKEEYAYTVLGIGIFVAANFFNISSYIKEIVLSAFTTRRDKNGDLKDEYIYSVKYTRDIFEKTKLIEIPNALEFFNLFENRINLSSTCTFKAIKPFEMPKEKEEKSVLQDVVEGLKGLGYKMADIEVILPTLKEMELESPGAYIKEALKLLNNK